MRLPSAPKTARPRSSSCAATAAVRLSMISETSRLRSWRSRCEDVRLVCERPCDLATALVQYPDERLGAAGESVSHGPASLVENTSKTIGVVAQRRRDLAVAMIEQARKLFRPARQGLGDGAAVLVEDARERLGVARQRRGDLAAAGVEKVDELARAGAERVVDRPAALAEQIDQLGCPRPDRVADLPAALVEADCHALEPADDPILESADGLVEHRRHLADAPAEVAVDILGLAESTSVSALLRAAIAWPTSSARISSAFATSRPPSAMTRASSPVRTTSAWLSASARAAERLVDAADERVESGRDLAGAFRRALLQEAELRFDDSVRLARPFRHGGRKGLAAIGDEPVHLLEVPRHALRERPDIPGQAVDKLAAPADCLLQPAEAGAEHAVDLAAAALDRCRRAPLPCGSGPR